MDTPSISIQPRQTVVISHASDEPFFGTGSWIPGASMPTVEGKFRLQFRLGGMAEFRTVAPVVEKVADVTLHQSTPFTDRYTRTTVTLPYKTIVVAVTNGAEHIIGIKKANVTANTSISINARGRLNAQSATRISPFLRVLTVTSAVTSLSASADSLDAITIDYALADGTHNLIHLDQHRRPQQSTAVQNRQ